MDIIRKDCFWYRPWKGMGTIIDQCNFHAVGECHCCEDCEMFITKKKVDEIIEWFVDVGRPWMERTL